MQGAIKTPEANIQLITLHPVMMAHNALFDPTIAFIALFIVRNDFATKFKVRYLWKERPSFCHWWYRALPTFVKTSLPRFFWILPRQKNRCKPFILEYLLHSWVCCQVSEGPYWRQWLCRSSGTSRFRCCLRCTRALVRTGRSSPTRSYGLATRYRKYGYTHFVYQYMPILIELYFSSVNRWASR